MIDLDWEMRVEANTSEYTIRGVLSMKCENDKWRPVVLSKDCDSS